MTDTVSRAFRYRIYPSQEQQKRLLEWENALRWLWNIAHEQRLLWLQRRGSTRRYSSWAQQCRETTELRRELPWLKDVSSRSCSAVLKRLDRAWTRRFGRIASSPRFKSKGRDAVSVDLDWREVRFVSPGHIRLAKLGVHRIITHRDLVGVTVAVTVLREGEQWFVAFTQRVDAAHVAQRPGTVGIDRGVVSLVADSDGKTIANPRFANRSRRKLARLQRALARTKKGSNNRAKARLRLARAHRKVRRQRAWLQHQISHDYANSHGTIVIEKLGTARMTRSARGSVDSPGRNVRAKAGLNRSILDAGWAGIATMLRYKLDEQGGQLVEVPAAYSSQTCSACGAVDAASRRSQSEFCCTACGHSENADVNAARVILSRWSPPVQPVEASSSDGPRSRKQPWLQATVFARLAAAGMGAAS